MGEAGMISAHLVRGTPDRAIERIADPLLQHPVGRKADRVLDPLGFQELVDPWHGEGRISPDDDSPGVPMAAHDGNVSPERRIIRWMSVKSSFMW